MRPWSLALLISTQAAAAARAANATRGFLLAATHAPIELLRFKPSDHDDLGALLRDVCATSYPARVVVADDAEAKEVDRKRPCDTIEPWVLPASGRRLAEVPASGRRLTDVRLRYFKVAAIAANANLFPGGTLYVDNDIALKRGAVGDLFRVFDKMAAARKAVALAPSHVCAPKQHRLGGVPSHFCERNSGLMFLAGAEARAVVAEWFHELKHHTSADGHDQMPLRKVLYRHRKALYDLPKKIQCRGHGSNPCAEGALVWHWHRNDRVKWAAAKKRGAAEVCGFVV